MAGSPRAYTIVFLLVVAFILYGSLYPFQFHAHPTETDPFAYLLSTWFATSWAETYLPGRSAETTDAVMALTIGGVFALLVDHAQRPP